MILHHMSVDVCFAYRNGFDPGILMPDRPELFGLLEEYDLRPVVSTGAEAAFDATGNVEAFEVETDDITVRPLGKLVLHDEVRVIINRADRTLRTPDLPTTINAGPVRSLGHRKWDAHRKVLEPMGIAMPTLMVASEQDVNDFADQIEAESFVAKPNTGRFEAGVYRVKREDAVQLFRDNAEWYGKYILQPAYDLTEPLPEEIEPLDDDISRQLFAELNQPGLTKEMRMYGFHADGQTCIYPVARTVGEGGRWFFVEPDTVPSSLYEKTDLAMKRVADVAGATALYGALDFGYGSTGTDEAPHWPVIEMNLRSPYLLGKNKHPAVALELRRMFAERINAAARQKTPVKPDSTPAS